MTYNNLFENTDVILALKNADIAKFNEIFGESYEYKILDGYIKFTMGEYHCTDKTIEYFTKKGIENIAKLLWLKYYENWKSVLKSLSVSYENADSENETIEHTQNVHSSSVSTSTENNKVFGYDSETASDNTLNDNTNDSNGTNELTEKTIRNKTGYNYGVSLFDLIKKYNDFKIENNFIDIVAKDIIIFLCYTIS
jgi:hypothetical protein